MPRERKDINKIKAETDALKNRNYRIGKSKSFFFLKILFERVRE